MRQEKKYFTAIPNKLLDDLLPHLSGNELKVAMVILRQTTGYHRREVKMTYEEIMRRTGIHSRATISMAIQGLRAKGFFDDDDDSPRSNYRPGDDYYIELDGDNQTEKPAKNLTNSPRASGAPAPRSVSQRPKNPGTRPSISNQGDAASSKNEPQTVQFLNSVPILYKDKINHHRAKDPLQRKDRDVAQLTLLDDDDEKQPDGNQPEIEHSDLPYSVASEEKPLGRDQWRAFLTSYEQITGRIITPSDERALASLVEEYDQDRVLVAIRKAVDKDAAYPIRYAHRILQNETVEAIKRVADRIHVVGQETIYESGPPGTVVEGLIFSAIPTRGATGEVVWIRRWNKPNTLRRIPGAKMLPYTFDDLKTHPYNVAVRAVPRPQNQN